MPAGHAESLIADQEIRQGCVDIELGYDYSYINRTEHWMPCCRSRSCRISAGFGRCFWSDGRKTGMDDLDLTREPFCLSTVHHGVLPGRAKAASCSADCERSAAVWALVLGRQAHMRALQMRGRWQMTRPIPGGALLVYGTGPRRKLLPHGSKGHGLRYGMQKRSLSQWSHDGWRH